MQTLFRPQLDAIAVAKLLGTNRDHVRRLARRGLIPHFKIGGVYRFDRDEIARWLEARRVPAKDAR